jgi:hypothetical protein
MSISVRMDRDCRLIWISLEGDVGDADLSAISRAARSHPKAAAGIGVLCDCTAVAGTAVSRDLIQELGTRARSHTNRIAFVTAAPVVFGLARMYQIVSDGDERMQFFVDRSAALSWLKSA